MTDFRGASLSVSLTPRGWRDPEVPNSEIVDVTELEAGDRLVIWSDWNTPRSEDLKSIEIYDDAVVIHRSNRSLPEVVPKHMKAMRKKHKK